MSTAVLSIVTMMADRRRSERARFTGAARGLSSPTRCHDRLDGRTVSRTRPRARPAGVRTCLSRSDDRAARAGRPDQRRRRDHGRIRRDDGLGGARLAAVARGRRLLRPDRRAVADRFGQRSLVHRAAPHRRRRSTTRSWSTGGRRSRRRSTGRRPSTRWASRSVGASRSTTATSRPTSTSTSTIPTPATSRPGSPTRCWPRSVPRARVRCARSSPRSRPSRTS